MEISRHLLENMFRMLSEKTGYKLDHQGFDDMSVTLKGDLSQKYLYENFQKLAKDESTETFNLQRTKVYGLLKFLGFGTLEEFEHFLKNPIPEILKSCEGTWINYVRQNSSLGIIYASPVMIFEKGHKMFYRLKGKEHMYEGEITLENGCLFARFKTENGKQFHHVYKIGSRRRPKVLQGIHSGVSTSNEPIGGRTVLIQTDRTFDEIKNQQLEITQCLDSDSEEEKALGNYFQSYDANNLKLKPVITYDLKDLLSN